MLMYFEKFWPERDDDIPYFSDLLLITSYVRVYYV